MKLGAVGIYSRASDEVGAHRGPGGQRGIGSALFQTRRLA